MTSEKGMDASSIGTDWRRNWRRFSNGSTRSGATVPGVDRAGADASEPWPLASGGAACAGPRARTATAAWWTSMPRPSSVARPPGRRRGQQRGHAPAGRRGRPPAGVGGQASSAVDRAATSPSMPTERGVDHQVGRRATSADRSPTRPDGAGQRGRGLGRARRCGSPPTTSAAPGLGQGQHHGPGRAAGAEHHAAPARRVEAGVGPQRRHEAGAVGVVADEPTPSRGATQLTAPSRPRPAWADARRPAVGHRRSCAASSPTAPRCRARACASSAAGRLARRHLERDVDPVEPGGRERGVEDGRRERVADRDRRSPRPAGVRPAGTAHPPSRPCCCGPLLGLAGSRCSRSVKKWLPFASAST